MERIVYFQQNISYGACEHYFEYLARHLDKSRYDVWLLHPDHSAFTPFSQLKDDGVRLLPYPCDLLNANSLGSIYKLSNLFRRIRPRMVHFNDPCVNGMLAAILARVPMVVMTHHTPELDRSYNWKGKMLEWLAFRSRPHVVFTSEPDFRTGVQRDHVSAQRSCVIPLGIDMERFALNVDGVAVRQELGIPLTDFVVGNVARLAPQKGHGYLIEAAKTVLSLDSNVTFVVVGDGALRDKLLDKVARAGIVGRFLFAGQRSDVPRLLSVFDLFVMPSLFEGLCMAVLEACAAGVPVVATPVGGVPSSVIEDETGKLVQPRDANALGGAILWMLNHPEKAREMGLRGRRRVEKQFTLEAMLADTQAIYERFLSRRESKVELA